LIRRGFSVLILSNDVTRSLDQTATMQTPATKLDSAEASRASTIRRAKPWYKHLSVQILLGMVLGILVGHMWPERADSWKPLGDLFIKLIRMLVAPIIFCTVVHGIASVEKQKRSAALLLNR
jgi:L-cystine uptake protein TcyP (sodium:dicarboxylate symporter family)